MDSLSLLMGMMPKTDQQIEFLDLYEPLPPIYKHPNKKAD